MADVPRLVAMWFASARHHAERDPEFYGLSPNAEREMRGYWESVINDSLRQAFVAEWPGAGVVGCLQADVRVFRVFARPTRGYLANVWVDEGYRGRGLGRLLVDRAVSWLQSHNVDLIVLNVSAANSEAISFYDHLGYRTANINLVRSARVE